MRRRGETFDRLQFATPETVHLSSLPCWAPARGATFFVSPHEVPPFSSAPQSQPSQPRLSLGLGVGLSFHNNL